VVLTAVHFLKTPISIFILGTHQSSPIILSITLAMLQFNPFVRFSLSAVVALARNSSTKTSSSTKTPKEMPTFSSISKKIKFSPPKSHASIYFLKFVSKAKRPTNM
jgi:hypothetical protein